MTMQWRSKDKGEKTWSAWDDCEDGDTIRFNTSLSWMSDLEIREKSAFWPGYFRPKYPRNAKAEWYDTDPNDLDDLYERVEVVKVDG